jgi:hypothetical protein
VFGRGQPISTAVSSPDKPSAPPPSNWPRRLIDSRFLAVALVLLLGLTAASPFATRRAVGSGEAYNYSLALADGVEQIRAGVLPPLVGQTEYAWNGRVHPLRDGPYLIYLAAALDLVTAHRLSFWELQNLSLGLSLIAAAFAAYAALRFATRSPPWAAAVLAGVYVLSPSLLMAANVQDLFMTVHAAVFVPLAIGLALRQADTPHWRYDMALAAVLAAAWTAHPPIALWLTGAVGLVRLRFLLRHPSWHECRGLLLAAAVGLVLAAFVFVSAGTLNRDVGYLAAHNDTLLRSSTEMVMRNLRESFPRALLPVTTGVNRPGDLQLGYGAALLLAGVCLGTAAAWRGWARMNLRGNADAAPPRSGSERPHGAPSNPNPWASPTGPRASPSQLDPAATLAGVALLFLLLLMPIPGLTRWLWLHVPFFVHSITNIWPTQRLYLIATGVAVLAGGSALPSWWETIGSSRHRWWPALAGAVLLGWTLFQAQPFLRAGWRARWTPDATRRSYAPSNLDLTVTSYSFINTRSDFLAGVSDPRFEFRLLRDRREVASPLAATLQSEPVTQGGLLATLNPEAANPGHNDRPAIVLQPNRRYVLTLSAAAPARLGGLTMTGSTLDRYYGLSSPAIWTRPAPDSPPQHSFVVWTDQPRAETVHLTLQSAGLAAAGGTGTGTATPPPACARFALREIAPGTLPVEVTSIFPLRAVVTAPDLGCRLTTCRRFIAGYRATVNGEVVPVTRSPEGEVMIPVPRGKSVVTLDYPGSGLLRAAFWLSAAGWSALVVGAGAGLAGYRFRPAPFLVARDFAVRHRRPLGVIATAAVVGAGGWAALASWQNYLGAVGPIYLRFMLPVDATGRRQAIASMGRRGAGTIVLVEYPDSSHIRLAADIWGQLYLSPPIETDYSRAQELVIDGSTLYPLDHPAVRGLARPEQDRLRSAFRLELNGRTVLTVARNAFESKVAEVVVGRSAIGGSSGERIFTGTLLADRREPIPHGFGPRPGEALQWSVPAVALAQDQPVPLLALGPAGQGGLLALVRRADDRLELKWYREGRLAATAVAAIRPHQAVTLRCAIGRGGSGDGEPTPSVTVDGRTVLGPVPERLIPLRDHPFVLSGLNPAGWDGLPHRFNALRTEPRVVPAFKRDRSDGPLSLAVLLPRNRPGRSEPLLVSGKAGAGDLIYVVYSDEHHVRFGVDHWGKFSRLGEPVAINYLEPHLVRLTGGPLGPTFAVRAGGASAGGKPADLQVELDGRLALHVPAYAAYPTEAKQITVGRNPIGGSTCDPGFTGSIIEQFRGGPD